MVMKGIAVVLVVLQWRNLRHQLSWLTHSKDELPLEPVKRLTIGWLRHDLGVTLILQDAHTQQSQRLRGGSLAIAFVRSVSVNTALVPSQRNFYVLIFAVKTFCFCEIFHRIQGMKRMGMWTGGGELRGPFLANPNPILPSFRGDPRRETDPCDRGGWSGGLCLG